MAINPNWSRWIFASFTRHFKTNLPNGSPTLYIEGEDRRTENINDYFEFRINGPNIVELHGYYKFEVGINILIVTKQNKNIHTIHNNAGLIASLFWRNISMLKLGADTLGVDDGSYLGCMCIYKREGKELDVSHIGQVNPDTLEMQAMVQALYTMRIEN